MKLEAFKSIVKGLNSENVRFLLAGGMAVVGHLDDIKHLRLLQNEQ